MEAPSVTGSKLAVVHGHSLPPGMTVDNPGLVPVPRHGLGHEVPAHMVDHRANIRAICEQGCDRVLALGSVGSLRTDWDALGPSFAPTTSSRRGSRRASTKTRAATASPGSTPIGAGA